ncbi:response regulator transcription factor [Shimwellia blattae]|uniref:Putative two component transcriptional regulator n=1 Tax=Shimwellia blattae (strain ATCC 29907 / DSM 4481 / JCM 1650 / NBRC 105725 / CDC 9005-74) TaxID=630626 RepID=I2B614_SHIBC|nr:response regulator [Shimwellia blattae]AFJ45968.1 putative two component transcriptional regulator [Shimwellia blattae DSM 4481 = NBRC 105725]GAB81723.1 putative two-component response regulator [Shimwellia blattae DSM 4481 = NBRC 105725]VDY63444.1 Transcriptional regulatory protein fixJ [Shimwellia blattae]VEC21343.1 Transcriptional regulatory protein fixJ [Shimwellia blattae]
MQRSPLYLVDDDASVLDALCFMLEGEGYQPLCFSGAEEFLLFMKQHPPLMANDGCLVLDWRMPEMSGQELQIILNQANSPLAVIFLTAHGDVPMAVESLKRGAVDFLQKPVDSTSLLQAIKLGQERSLSELLLRKQLQAYEKLTCRERDILRLLFTGKTNNQVAEQCHIAVRTVEVHRANIMQHLEVSSTAEMIRHYAAIEHYLYLAAPAPVRIRRKKISGK